ncbi:unnamed protein product [Gongylonema pulchrum]|uniref:Rho-GAP domain-containing protein n=1 Tax=Gongylonema pulchrum TaxID=637853 RepID=A0A183DG31_9BILA|nr:unnamed protein product [Gongylonema pulchrum]
MEDVLQVKVDLLEKMPRSSHHDRISLVYSVMDSYSSDADRSVLCTNAASIFLLHLMKEQLKNKYLQLKPMHLGYDVSEKQSCSAAAGRALLAKIPHLPHVSDEALNVIVGFRDSFIASNRTEMIQLLR